MILCCHIFQTSKFKSVQAGAMGFNLASADEWGEIRTNFTGRKPFQLLLTNCMLTKAYLHTLDFYEFTLYMLNLTHVSLPPSSSPLQACP